jgi:hypothetical protein
LHKKVKELAQQEGVSINQFVTVAVAEKLSALMTEDYLQERARRGSRSRYEAALAQVPDGEPEERDRIEPGLLGRLRSDHNSRYIHEERKLYEVGEAEHRTDGPQ